MSNYAKMNGVTLIFFSSTKEECKSMEEML
jgi:hypothetical protein